LGLWGLMVPMVLILLYYLVAQLLQLNLVGHSALFDQSGQKDLMGHLVQKALYHQVVLVHQMVQRAQFHQLVQMGL